MYPPSITKRKRYKKCKPMGLLDMEKRYASAGPNKQMYEMYNMSMRGNIDASTSHYTGINNNSTAGLPLPGLDAMGA